LMANDPQQRPSLSMLEWHKWLDTPPSDVAKVEVDGESMKPPVAKRPKLAVLERAVQLQPELYGTDEHLDLPPENKRGRN